MTPQIKEFEVAIDEQISVFPSQSNHLSPKAVDTLVIVNLLREIDILMNLRSPSCWVDGESSMLIQVKRRACVITSQQSRVRQRIRQVAARLLHAVIVSDEY